MEAEKIEILNIEGSDGMNLSFLSNKVPAGFPSPAQDCDSDSIDLNRELISSPASTFCARVTGDSMVGCGIADGDLLIIDKSLAPADGNIAVCFIDGEFTVKRLSIKADGIYLVPANSHYPSLKVNEGSNFQVWGVVSHIIKKTT